MVHKDDEGASPTASGGVVSRAEYDQAVEDWARNDEQVLAENQRLADELALALERIAKARQALRLDEKWSVQHGALAIRSERDRAGAERDVLAWLHAEAVWQRNENAKLWASAQLEVEARGEVIAGWIRYRDRTNAAKREWRQRVTEAKAERDALRAQLAAAIGTPSPEERAELLRFINERGVEDLDAEELADAVTQLLRPDGPGCWAEDDGAALVSESVPATSGTCGQVHDGQSLPDDAEKQLRLAISDPGSQLKRLHDEWDGAYEPLHRWGARAVLQLITPWFTSKADPSPEASSAASPNPQITNEINAATPPAAGEADTTPPRSYVVDFEPGLYGPFASVTEAHAWAESHVRAVMGGNGSWTVGPLRPPVEVLPDTEQETEK